MTSLRKHKKHLANQPRAGSREVRNHVRLFGGYEEHTRNGHVKAKTYDDKTAGTYPANRKELRKGTLKSVIRMLQDAGMWILLIGLPGALTIRGMEILTGRDMLEMLISLL